ncbi:protein tyrosine phosphatase family protein [Salinimonas lutimaris]|uniref:protein tyrosine phosphatase family protein n=1 Tax=Salinimonas lutimaris TaxID=914153 RepID=UPI0010C0B65C|nr:protein tyrosine phosphatase family protein [Salinimonas lutimaris]
MTSGLKKHGQALMMATALICHAGLAVGKTGEATGTGEAAGAIDTIENYQVNSPTMISAGQPAPAHFAAFKAMGVDQVIDLIPGDRRAEQQLVHGLGMEYHNIQVVWDNPTLANFQDYVAVMQQTQGQGERVLTHCRKNWRGAVFTYLYRVTQLGEADAVARQDLATTWQPNETWQAFIEKVKKAYASSPQAD